ncbi:hypothetical protein BX616_003137, partial [Lobosporangium transversale]
MGWMQSMPKRGQLPPQKALDLATIYLEHAHKTNDPVLTLEICLDAESVLSRIHRSDRKSLLSASTDKTLCKAISAALNDIGELFDNLGHPDHSKRGHKYAAEWGHVRQVNPTSDSSGTLHQATNTSKDGYSDSNNEYGDNNNNSSNSNSNNNQCNNRDNNSDNKSSQQDTGTYTNGVDDTIKAPEASTTHNPPTSSKDIFDHDIPPVVHKYSLPDLGAHLDGTHQLVYCLSLLHTAHQSLTALTVQEQQWFLVTSNDQDEQLRLYNLASDVIAIFIQESVKNGPAVAEVVMLAPVLDYDQYRAVLMALINRISQNIMLDTHLLEGLAQLMQHTSPGYLDSDDLVNILNILSSRLQSTHSQCGSHIYQLCVTVSHVLDAMVDNQVKGLKREQLHEPLAAYLKELQESSDPHLAYHAAYASQALLYIPNDETPMQAMLRRTSAVARGVFG